LRTLCRPAGTTTVDTKQNCYRHHWVQDSCEARSSICPHLVCGHLAECAHTLQQLPAVLNNLQGCSQEAEHSTSSRMHGTQAYQQTRPSMKCHRSAVPGPSALLHGTCILCKRLSHRQFTPHLCPQSAGPSWVPCAQSSCGSAWGPAGSAGQ
jgi:hypothetical protein